MASPAGYYEASQPVGDVTYSFWFQFCSTMLVTPGDPAGPGPVCARKGADSNCPKSCRAPAAGEACGSGCSALMAQRAPGRPHAACWAVGQWDEGRKVSLSLLDPTDPGAGVVYTLLGGDRKGCPAGVARTLSIAIRCPGVGMPAVPVLNVSSLGNCAYAAFMAHPAACPLKAGQLPRPERRLPYVRGVAVPVPPRRGSTAGNLGGFLLGVMALLATYCMVGVAWRAGVHGRRGGEALPNPNFWRNLPDTLAAAAAGAAAEANALLSALEHPGDGPDEAERASAAQPLLGVRPL